MLHSRYTSGIGGLGNLSEKMGWPAAAHQPSWVEGTSLSDGQAEGSQDYTQPCTSTGGLDARFQRICHC